MLADMLMEENSVLQMEVELYSKVKAKMDKNHREYYLREQIKSINEELGEDDVESEVETYIETIKTLNIEEKHAEKLEKDAKKLLRMPQTSSEAAVIRSYLDFVLELPWNETTEDNVDIVAAQKKLDNDHYGMDRVKERIIETLAVKVMSPDIKGQIICLYGPPGVGKTSIAKSIADCMGRKYGRLSLGGVRD